MDTPSNSGGSSSSTSDLLKIGLLGAGGFAAYEFLYKPYAIKKELERVTAAALAENLKKGMSMTEAAQSAIGGACVAAAQAYKIPPAASGAACQGVGILATKGIQLAAKGAVIAGKAIGQGTVAAAKGIGKAGEVVGKGVAKGTVAVVYKAPKAIIGGTVNKTDQILSAVASKIVPKAVIKVIPKPVKKVAAVTKKVVKKVLCLGFLCGLDGLDDDATLAYLGEVAPEAYTQRLLTQLAAGPRANPLAVHARERSLRPAGVRSVRSIRAVVPSPHRTADGAGFYGRYL